MIHWITHSEHGTSGGKSQRQRHEWCEFVTLKVEPLSAGRNFIRPWGAISGWSTLHHVRHETFITADVELFAQQTEEKLTTATHERLSSFIFVTTRGFADEQEAGGAWSAPEDYGGSRCGQRAPCALQCVLE